MMDDMDKLALVKEKAEKQQPFSFKFRKLKAEDLFLMSRIISKIGIEDFMSCLGSPDVMGLIQKVMEKGEGEKLEVEDRELVVGVGVALVIANKVLARLPACRADIYELLGNVSGMAPEEVAELEACDFLDMLVAFIRKEEFPNFIKVVSKYFG